MIAASSRIPLWVKLVYTAFVAVLVPFYWKAYGPTNFLYFCDVALLMGLVAVWTEHSLWASAPLTGILVVQLVWMVDFLAGAIGHPLTGMTDYMFDENNTLFTRGLSFFHFWLPWFLMYLVWRLGYDRRAWLTWTLITWVLLLVCYFLMPAPPPPSDNMNLPVNINYVYGMSDTAPQQMMEGWLWFLLEMILLPFAICLPTHLFLCWLFPPAKST
jgi:hypothetical protein